MPEQRSLTVIRGIAAFAVTLYHISFVFSANWRGTLSYGRYGVDVFFVLSGYILTAVYADLTVKDVPRFWINRIARIFPLHLAVLAAMETSIVLLTLADWPIHYQRFFDLRILPYHATLTSVWFGLEPGWNTPAWSLSVEWAAYLIFPAWLFVARRLGYGPLTALGIVLAGLAIANLRLHGLASAGWQAMARGLLEFAVGSVLGLMPLRGRLIAATRKFGALLLDWPPLVWLGRVSYSIYLLQIPLILLLFKVAPRMNVVETTILFFGLLLAGSQVTFMLIETPGRRGLRFLFERPLALFEETVSVKAA
jgi:peptidoglycan/LPS O-acetylase OafA/YrhL